MFKKSLKSYVKQRQRWPIRLLSTEMKAYSLQYEKHGDPLKVLALYECPMSPPEGKKVLVRVLAAPINPSDVNTIQGKYPIKPAKLPAIAGHECVGEVLCVGKEVNKLRPGDRVIPAVAGLGTWTTMALWDEQQLLRISNKICLAEAATMAVNPCSAYRMLKDFVPLEAGDTIIQNGANSGVGRAVHQLCKAWQVNSVGVVRNRPDVAKLKDTLKNLGATEVFTEEELDKTDIFKTGKLKKPQLALNCIGGKSSIGLARQLEACGVMITYGGMSMEPVMGPTAPFIFKNIVFRGFWITRWNAENKDNPERAKMIDELSQLAEQGNMVAPPHDIVPMTAFGKAASAFCLAKNGFSGKKIILSMAI